MAELSFDETKLAAIRIVLVAPAGPLNIGSVARVMKNFGLSQLVLVAPQCDPLGAEALQMAVHADDILRAAKQVDTIPEALAGCERAIATTARIRGFNAPLHPPEIALPQLLHFDSVTEHSQNQPVTEHSQNQPVTERSQNQLVTERSRSALLFGPEDRGLSNEELTYAQHFTKIPSSDTYSALNLAQAVAICCYELRRATQISPTPRQPLNAAAAPQENVSVSGKASTKQTSEKSGEGSDTSLQNSPLSDKQTESTRQPKATLDELEGYYQHLESLLLKVEYLYPHTAASRMRKLRQLLHRSEPTSNEVALLRGILRQVEWATSNANRSDST